MINSLKQMMPAGLKPRLRRWLIGHDIGTYYYAQYGEDIMLHRILSDLLGDPTRYRGVFVDVGAYHPVKYSNTYFFYKCGWRGINIDPRPGSMQLFEKIRPADINLELGVSDQEAVMTYYDLGEDSTMNTFSLQHLEALGMTKSIQRTVPVQTFRLSTLLDKHLTGNSIDLLNIDAEGFDFEILQSNNWEKYRPLVICVELSPVKTINDILDTPTYLYLKGMGYDVYTKNYITNKISSVVFVDSKRS